MDHLRYLTNKEINFLVSDLKFHKTDVKNILRTKGKVYKLTKTDLTKLKKKISDFFESSSTPRYLTEEEINYILGDLPEIPSCFSEIRKFNREKIINTLKFDISTFRVCPRKETLDNIKKIIEETYLKSLCQAGDSVGSSGAMSLGQAMSQAALDAFHTAGSQNLQDDELNLLNQLLNPNTKKATSSCNVHFKDKNLTKEELLKGYIKKFKGISVQSLIISSEILQKVPSEDEEMYKNHEIIYNRKVDTSNKFLRLSINTYRCYSYDITIKDICDLIEKTTMTQSGKNTVYCVGSSTFSGIIDIHVETEFISSSVQDFVDKGRTFSTCEKKYRGKIVNTEDGKKRTYLKTILDVNSDINDLVSIFLEVILQEECFKDMILKGIKGIENIIVLDNKLSSSMKFKKLWNDKEVNKYVSRDFNVNPDEIYRLYYVFVDYYSINILGIPGSKYVKFLESCGVEVIDYHLDSETRPYCVILLPEIPDIKIKEEDEEKLKTNIESEKNPEIKKILKETLADFENLVGQDKFIKHGEVILDRINYKEAITPEEPSQLIARKFSESEKILKEYILSEDNNLELNKFPEIYRYGIYCYIKIYGKNILSKLLKDRSVDPYFSCPNAVNDVMEYYGIESSRLFFIREYNKDSEIQKMNPVNIELLVDFQTTMGQIYAVTSTDVGKTAKNALLAASFEQPLEQFRKASSIGTIDTINNIPSCLITGKKNINGTGIVEVSYDDDYKKDPFNKVDTGVRNEIKISNVSNKEIQGGCFAAGNFIKDNDFEKEENDALEATEDFRESGFFNSGPGNTDNSIPDIDLDIGQDLELEDSIFDI